jgi:hypothetical protein
MADDDVSLIDEAGTRLLDGMERGTLLWRVIVTGSIAGIGLYIAWSLGFLTFLSAGFARADDVKELKGQVADVRASLIAEKIDAVTTSLCMESFDARLLDYRRTLQDQYRQVTGHEHESPPCEILLKLKR